MLNQNITTKAFVELFAGQTLPLLIQVKTGRVRIALQAATPTAEGPSYDLNSGDFFVIPVRQGTDKIWARLSSSSPPASVVAYQAPSGSAGAVSSVNGLTGDVVLNTSNIPNASNSVFGLNASQALDALADKTFLVNTGTSIDTTTIPLNSFKTISKTEFPNLVFTTNDTTGGLLTFNNTTGIFSYTGTTPARVRLGVIIGSQPSTGQFENLTGMVQVNTGTGWVSFEDSLRSAQIANQTSGSAQLDSSGSTTLAAGTQFRFQIGSGVGNTNILQRYTFAGAVRPAIAIQIQITTIYK